MANLKLEIHNHQAAGDTLCMTCAIRDLKNSFPDRYDIKPVTNYMHIWDNNPYISDFDSADIVIKVGTGIGVNRSQSTHLHMCEAYRLSIEDKLNISIKQGPIRPDVHLSSEEIEKPPLVEGHYWLIAPGTRNQFTSKIWPYDRWQQVVEAFPNITFVQIGLREHPTPLLQGKNVINFTGKTEDPNTGIRDLFKLCYHAQGGLSLVSFLMHLMAAFQKPCVVVAGAREPASFEAYNFHRYLHNQGSLYCPKFTDITKSCWRTSVEGCSNRTSDGYPKCLDMITVDDVVKAVESYYIGGRLVLGDTYVYREEEEKQEAPIFVQEPLEPTEEELRNVMMGVVEPTKPALEVPEPTENEIKRLIKEVIQKTKTQGPIEGTTELVKEVIQTQEPVEGTAEPTKEAIQGTGENETSVTNASTPKLHKEGKIFKMVCNASSLGGGEKSAIWIMNRMVQEGYKVFLVPTSNVSSTFTTHIPNVEVTNQLTAPCDILMFYTNDSVFSFHEEKYQIFAKVQAVKKVMVLNYKIGKTVEVSWSKNWDRYVFLNTTMEKSFLEKLPTAKTTVLPPPVDLSPFLSIDLGSLNKTLHIVRHSSQGDRKYPKFINELIRKIREKDSKCKFSFMPPPTFLDTSIPNISCFRYDEVPVPDFLKRGNLFWYPLPENYTDQGPRVIIEAMAIGLPVIADNRDGAKDRVTPETGWLCNNKDEYVDIITNIKGKELSKKGEAAKERAAKEFNPEKWINMLLEL